MATSIVMRYYRTGDFDKYCSCRGTALGCIYVSGRAVATPYLGMTLVFWGFGRFQVSETAINQTQNLKLMREMQSTGQTDPVESIRCLQMCPRAQGRISEKPHIFLSFFLLLSLSTRLAITMLH